MKKKNSMRVCLLLVLVGMRAAGYALVAQDEREEWVKKADALAQKLATFVPQPVAGLTDHTPWKSAGRPPWTNYACGETGCPGLFAPIAAGREL